MSEFVNLPLYSACKSNRITTASHKDIRRVSRIVFETVIRDARFGFNGIALSGLPRQQQ
jgi:hypothetical protein